MCASLCGCAQVGAVVPGVCMSARAGMQDEFSEHLLKIRADSGKCISYTNFSFIRLLLMLV